MPSEPYQKQATQSPHPPLLDELSPEQWAMWRRHPVTALVLERYLPDFRAELERATLDGWMSGQLTLAHEQQCRGHLLGARQMENLSLELIRVFYGMEGRADDVPKRGNFW